MEPYIQNGQQQNDQNSSINLRDLVYFIWRLRWWIIASMFLALCAGFLYVRMQTPVYQRSSWIMLNKNDGSNADLALLATMTGRTVQKRIDNEVFILRSPSLMRQAVDEHELNKRYFKYGLPVGDRIKFGRALFDIKRSEFYKNNPFTVTMSMDSTAMEEGANIQMIS